MPDAVEAVGQAVDQKAPNKLVWSERHHPWCVAVSIIAPAEGHTRLIGADQAAVGDGDAVRVAAEIGENMLGRAEWRLGEDDPVLATKLTDRCSKSVGIIERAELAREAQPAAEMGRLEPFEEQPPEKAGEHTDGQEKARPTGKPTFAIHKRASRNEAVDVRMMGERLSPCVENGEKADLAAEVPRIRGNGLERRRHRIEQDRIDDSLVVEGNLRGFRRHCEHDMEVRHGQ